MDNMLDISREAFPHPALSRLSSVLHESEVATQRGIDRAFPVSLTGLAEHARRQKNADDMLGHFQKGDYPHLAPLEVAPLVTDPLRTARLAASGEGFLASIFGSKLDEVVDLVAHQAGVSRTSAHVILGLSAPLLLDAVGKESVLRRFDANGLTNFLDVQEENARTLLPSVVERVSQAVSATAGPAAGAALPMKTLSGYAPPRVQPANQQVTPQRTEAPRRAVRGAHSPMAQSPTARDRVADSSEPARASGWRIFLMIASAALLALLGWLAFRMIPRPTPVPARPSNLGSQTEAAPGTEAAAPPPGTEAARSPQDASESLPGGVAKPAESAPPGAVAAGTSDVEARGQSRAQTSPQARQARSDTVSSRKAAAHATRGATTPALGGLAPATQAKDMIEDAELALSATRSASAQGARRERLTGQEAVDALPAATGQLQQPPALGPNNPLNPAAQSEGAEPVADGERPNGIAEAVPNQVQTKRPETAMAPYFEGGARVPQRFVVEDHTFAPHSAALHGENASLNDAAELLRAHPSAVVLIEGFGDVSDASHSEQPELANARAASVSAYLEARGVAASQLRLPQHPTAEVPQGGQVNLIVLRR